jgi:hypothetical protein
MSRGGTPTIDSPRVRMQASPLPHSAILTGGYVTLPRGASVN